MDAGQSTHQLNLTVVFPKKHALYCLTIPTVCLPNIFASWLTVVNRVLVSGSPAHARYFSTCRHADPIIVPW